MLPIVTQPSHIPLGDTENAWETAGLAAGLQIWRIDKFKVISWPKERIGTFYDGDSYLVLHVSEPVLI